MNARPRLFALVLASSVLLTSHSRAAEPALRASLSCPPEATPGRIVCELAVQAGEGKLVWSDALVVRAPTFARPLRSRFVAQLTPSGGASAKLALVASSAGEGQLELLARAVLCHDASAGEWCEPVRASVTVGLHVAPLSLPAP